MLLVAILEDMEVSKATAMVIKVTAMAIKDMPMVEVDTTMDMVRITAVDMEVMTTLAITTKVAVAMEELLLVDMVSIYYHGFLNIDCEYKASYNGVPMDKFFYSSILFSCFAD